MNQKIDWDDWRFTAGPASGRLDSFRNISLCYLPFQPLSPAWDHEHCAFCWEKLALQGEGLRAGYCTRPENARDADWICPACYEELRDALGWTLEKEVST